MRYIPAKVVFDDLETTYLKGYVQQWDAGGEKRKAIDAATEFDICTVRENDENTRGFRIDYGEGEVSYVSFEGLTQYLLTQGHFKGKQYQMAFKGESE